MARKQPKRPDKWDKAAHIFVYERGANIAHFCSYESANIIEKQLAAWGRRLDRAAWRAGIAQGRYGDAKYDRRKP